MIFPAGGERGADDNNAADEHITTSRRRYHLRPSRSFHCQATLPCDCVGEWQWWSCWWPSNCPCRDCISRRCSSPRSFDQVHPRRSFHCQSTLPCEGLGQWVRWLCWRSEERRVGDDISRRW